MSDQAQGYWWCQHCKEEIGPYHVTYGEKHEACGHPAEWIELDAPSYAALQAEVERLRAKVGELSRMLSEATPLVRYFTARNQRWKNRDGVLQDPHGSHALLEKLEALQQP